MGKKAQIWIEVVVYTLIGLAIIGILLSIIKPVIEQKKDQLILEQSLDMVNGIESQIEEVVFYGPGNSRKIEIKIEKGQLSINSQNDYIEFSMKSKHKYSEPEQEVEIGRVKALTKEKGKEYEVFLMLNYSESLNLTYDNKETDKTFHKSPTPYKILITNLGKTSESELTQIDFS